MRNTIQLMNPIPKHHTKKLKGFLLKSGDIVLLATDGILDNLFTAEIEEVVNSTFGIK